MASFKTNDRNVSVTNMSHQKNYQKSQRKKSSWHLNLFYSREFSQMFYQGFVELFVVHFGPRCEHWFKSTHSAWIVVGNSNASLRNILEWVSMPSQLLNRKALVHSSSTLCIFCYAILWWANVFELKKAGACQQTSSVCERWSLNSIYLSVHFLQILVRQDADCHHLARTCVKEVVIHFGTSVVEIWNSKIVTYNGDKWVQFDNKHTKPK